MTQRISNSLGLVSLGALVLILGSAAPASTAGAPSGGAELVFTVSGECPGALTITVAGGTPSGSVGLLASDATGDDALANGPCAGTETGLSDPALFSIMQLTVLGGFTISRNAPAGVCGRYLQIIEPGAGCILSTVEQIPIGSAASSSP